MGAVAVGGDHAQEAEGRVGSGPLFYNLDETPRANVDTLKPSRSRAATARAHLSD